MVRPPDREVRAGRVAAEFLIASPGPDRERDGIGADVVPRVAARVAEIVGDEEPDGACGQLHARHRIPSGRGVDAGEIAVGESTSRRSQDARPEALFELCVGEFARRPVLELGG